MESQNLSIGAHWRAYCIEVPLTLDSEGVIDNVTSTGEESVRQPGTASGLSVLLLEDEPIYAEAILQKFKLLNIDCQWTKSARQAEKLLSATSFDLVLLDTQLPDSPDGVIVKSISRDRAGTLFPPTVIISGNVYGKTITQWMHQGANLILNKPIAMQELKQLLVLYEQNHDFPIYENTCSIDKDFLHNEIQILGVEEVNKLINIYLDTTPLALEAICQNFAMQKYIDCARALHKHRSALSSLGLSGLADITTQAETHCTQQQRVNLSFSLYQLVRDSRIIEQQLRVFIQEHSAQ